MFHGKNCEIVVYICCCSSSIFVFVFVVVVVIVVVVFLLDHHLCVFIYLFNQILSKDLKQSIILDLKGLFECLDST